MTALSDNTSAAVSKSISVSSTQWLEFGLVNRTGANKVRDLYFLKALALGCSKLILGNCADFHPAETLDHNQI